jgi:hypothetical protein
VLAVLRRDAERVGHAIHVTATMRQGTDAAFPRGDGRRRGHGHYGEDNQTETTTRARMGDVSHATTGDARDQRSLFAKNWKAIRQVVARPIFQLTGRLRQAKFASVIFSSESILPG